MAEMPEKRPLQPFTFCGVARFAHGPLIRLYGVALGFAVLSGVVFIIFGAIAWAPAIDEAIGNLPANSGIRGGSLAWPSNEAATLGSNPFLSIAVQPPGTANESTPADIAIRLLPRDVEFQSILGFMHLGYPNGWSIALNRETLAPAWGAWKPAILTLGGVIVAIALVLSWGVLGAAYLLIPLSISRGIKRTLSAPEAWKLSVAAQMSGAVLINFGIVLYGLAEISLLFLLAIFIAHFLLSWLYLLVSPFCLPEQKAAGKKNPFRTERPRKTNNPFASGEDRDE